MLLMLLSICALLERERSIEHWLHAELAPAWDALKADPARAATAAQVRARLAAEHAKMQCKMAHIPTD